MAYNANDHWHREFVLIRTSREVGLLIRDRRRAIGLTQAELAERVGASREWVRQLESGKPRLELALTLRAFSALGIALNAELEAEPSQRTTPPSTPPPPKTLRRKNRG